MKRSFDTPSTLEIVPTHASFYAEVEAKDLTAENVLSNDRWVLATFQQGEPPFYAEHLRSGVDAVAADPDSHLVISGGFTRPESTLDAKTGQPVDAPWSEAHTYLTVGEKSLWLPSLEHGTPHNISLDLFARDSIQNLIGAVYTFKQRFGELPKNIRAHGWEFKRDRFEHHAEAIGIPKAKFTYVGVNNPRDEDLAGAEKGESKTFDAFRADPLGEHGELAVKRVERDPLKQGNPYDSMGKIQM